MIFLTAPQELGFPPEHCFVAEDGSSGVQVAKAGEMAALGVARLNDQALLNEAGANLMVTLLDDVAVRAQREGWLDRATIRLG
jgi:beta-phosphoglucomutase